MDVSTIKLYQGHLGLSGCPGWPVARGGSDPEAVAVRIRDWPFRAVVSLMEAAEFRALGIDTLPPALSDHLPLWLHLPIRDGDVPGPRWLERWPLARLVIAGVLLEGDNVLVHCLAGHGRTGLVAALCLIDSGRYRGQEAIDEVRSAHSINAVESMEQEGFVAAYRPEPPLDAAAVRSGFDDLAAATGFELRRADGSLDDSAARALLGSR